MSPIPLREDNGTSTFSALLTPKRQADVRPILTVSSIELQSVVWICLQSIYTRMRMSAGSERSFSRTLMWQ